MNYEVLELKKINMKLLEAHADAKGADTDNDDRMIVGASVNNLGKILNPIIVKKQDSGGKYWVLDGVGRVDSAKSMGMTEMNCIVVECDDTSKFVAHINNAGRKRNTGSRIIFFLKACWDKVEAAQAPELPRGNHGKNGRFSPKQEPSEFEQWTFKGISEQLGVREGDVSNAYELLKCKTNKTYPKVKIDKVKVFGLPIEDKVHLEKLEKTYNDVMSGETSIRTFRPSFAGHSVKDNHGQNNRNYTNLAMKTMISLKTVFEGWDGVRFESRTKIVAAFKEAMEKLPGDLRPTAVTALASVKMKK